MRHWWLKEKKFERVRYSTLLRLGLLFQSEIAGGKQEDNVSTFLIWLEKYMEEQD